MKFDFVIIANAWAAARDNPTSKHQIARELVRAGHRVLWVEGAGMRRPSFGSGQDRGRMVRKVRAALRGAVRDEEAGLWVLAPLLVPLPGLAWVRVFNGWLFRQVAWHWARRLGFREPVLINYVPVLAGAMKGWKGKIVYHCVDRWDQFDMYDTAMMQKMDRQCRAHAGLVIASSEELAAHCRQDHPNVHLVGHGVNFAHFAKALVVPPDERPVGLPEGVIVGFIGLLSEWVDQELILAVARAVPEAHVVLIGKADVDVARLRGVPNLHVLGPRPFEDLPLYVAHFSVGIIPFVVSELTRAVNPIKLREMLAAGCPVVSTALPEVARYAGVLEGVHVARDPGDFVAQTRRWVGAPLVGEARWRLSEAMRGETWDVKTREIVGLIEGMRGEGRGGKGGTP